MPEFVDIHSHINFPDYDSDREEVVARLRESKTWTITVGTELESSKRAVEYADLYPELFASIGIHPTDTPNEEFNEEKFGELVKNKKVVAIGECGLDYFRLKGESLEEKAKQKKNFEAQINFACAHNLPLMIHCRDAYDDVIDMLAAHKKQYGDKLRGDVHFFAGDIDIARKFIDLDFTLSFTGVITFTHDYDDVVRFVPENMLLAETDAPFVSPVPYRGKRNEPAYVQEVVKALAKVRDDDFQTLKKALISNTFRVFNLS